MFFREPAQPWAACLRLSILAVCVALMFCACTGGGRSSTPPPPPPKIMSITISASNTTIALGLTQQLTATANYDNGSTQNLTNSVVWSSSANAVATVSLTGLLSSVGQGNATITATSGSVSSTFAITIGPPVLLSIAISPSPMTVDMSSGSQPHFTASAKYTDKTIDVTSSTSWSIVNNYVASIDTGGAVTAHKSGHTSVSATFNNMNSSAELTVQAPPRFVYVTSDTGRLITRAAVDHSSGVLRYESYLSTSMPTGAFECVTTDPLNQHAYLSLTVPNPGTGGSPGAVAIFTIDPATGALTAQGAPMNVQNPLGCIEFEPSGKFGYSVSQINNQSNPIVIFARNANDGTLSVTNTVQLASQGNGGIVIDPLGQYLYLSSLYSGSGTEALAYGFAIDSNTGALTAVPGTPFQLSNNAGQFAIDQAGRFLYMSNTNGASIDVYSIDRATGKLTALSALSLNTCINPTPLEFAPSNTFAYSTCSMDTQHDTKSASVESFSVSNSGQLSQIGSAPTGDASHQLSLDPSGGSAYVTGFSNYIYSYQIGNDGIAHAGRIVGAQAQSNSIAIVGGTAGVTYTPTYAYIASAGDNKLTTYSVQSDGSLIAGTSVTTQTSPVVLTSQPWSNDLLLGSAAAKPNVAPFTLNSTTGIATPGSLFGDATTLGGVATDISDQWAFVSDSSNGVVYTYLNEGGSVWGLLGYPAGTSFPAGSQPGPLAVDPAGRLLYVANQGDNTISAFQYFGTSPQLNVVTGSPYTLASRPVALTLDSTGLFLYVATADQQLSVYAVDYLNGGKLTLLGSQALPGNPAALAVEPSGKYLYSADSSGIGVFSINSSTGALTGIGPSPAINLSNCKGVWVEPSGRYLYAGTSTSSSGAIDAYKINSDGTLTALTGNPVATPNQPTAMTFKATIR